MRNNNSTGFTIFEVLLAMGILLTSVVILTDLQFRALFRIIDERDKIEKVFLLKSSMYGHFFQPPPVGKKVGNKLDEDKVSVVTEVKEVNDRSSLKLFKKLIKFITTNVSWKSGKHLCEEMMVSIVHQPTKEENK